MFFFISKMCVMLSIITTIIIIIIVNVFTLTAVRHFKLILKREGNNFFWHNVLIYVKMQRHWFEQLRTSHQVLEGLVKWLLKKLFVLVYANEWDKTFFKPIPRIFRCVIIWFFHRILHDLSLFFVRVWWIRNSYVDFFCDKFAFIVESV